MISVIIPTFNREAILERSLRSLFDQTYHKDRYEIVVVDDGSADNTAQLVAHLTSHAPCELRYLRQENRGPAAAKNLGIRNATGDLILFTNDDCVFRSDTVAQHAASHADYPDENVAILGLLTWHHDIPITPFMRWLEDKGPHFAYYQLTNGQLAGYRHFYTCNVSLKTRFLLAHGLFDEQFQDPAAEDVELGYRLAKEGLQLRYTSESVVYHYHPTDIARFCEQHRMVGASVALLGRKWADLSPWWARKDLNTRDRCRSKMMQIVCNSLVASLLRAMILRVDKKGISVPDKLYAIVCHYCFRNGFARMRIPDRHAGHGDHHTSPIVRS